MKILITAGPTHETIDAVRYLSNRSSGKMGYALAQEAQQRGWEVLLISGPVSLECPEGVQVEHVQSAQEMFDRVKHHQISQDIMVMCAAVADYTPVETVTHKRKKSDANWVLELKKTPDILHYLGHHRQGHELVAGFCLETENLLSHARQKLERKKADVIFANPASTMDSNEIHCFMVTHEEEIEWETQNKKVMASKMMDALTEIKEKSHA